MTRAYYYSPMLCLQKATNHMSYIYVMPVYKNLVQCVESMSGFSNNLCQSKISFQEISVKGVKVTSNNNQRARLAVNNELLVSIKLVYQGCRIIFRFGRMIAACNIK